MSARFEVVRSDAVQPWHARLRVNGEITWTTEQYARKVGAERQVRSLVAHVLGSGVTAVELVANVPGVEGALLVGDSVGIHPPLVTYVDERAAR